MRISILFLALSALGSTPETGTIPGTRTMWNVERPGNPTAVCLQSKQLNKAGTETWTVSSIPEGFECVRYQDESGQLVGILTRKPPVKKRTKAIVNDCPGCQQTSPLMEFVSADYVANTAGTIIAVLDSTERYFSLQETDPAFTSPYLKVEVDEGYAPKSITIRVDGKDVKMDWAEFIFMVLEWRQSKVRGVCADDKGNSSRPDPDGSCSQRPVVADWSKDSIPQ